MPGQGGPGSDGNKGVLHIPQSSSITGTSPSDCLVSYQDTHCWGLPLCRGTVVCILQLQPTGQQYFCLTFLHLLIKTDLLLTTVGVSLYQVAQSAKALQYTDCIAVEGKTINPAMGFLDMTLNNLKAWLQLYWSFGEYGVSLHCHCSQIHSGWECWHPIGSYLWVK